MGNVTEDGVYFHLSGLQIKDMLKNVTEYLLKLETDSTNVKAWTIC